MANQALREQVSKRVIEQIKDSVQKVVYDAYKPKRYVRTGKLQDPKYMKITQDGEAVVITSERPADYGPTKYQTASEIVTYGDGYTWGKNLGEKIGPRPFMEHAANELEKQNVLKQEMANMFRAQGFRVR